MSKIGLAVVVLSAALVAGFWAMYGFPYSSNVLTIWNGGWQIQLPQTSRAWDCLLGPITTVLVTFLITREDIKKERHFPYVICGLAAMMTVVGLFVPNFGIICGLAFCAFMSILLAAGMYNEEMRLRMGFIIIATAGIGLGLGSGLLSGILPGILTALIAMAFSVVIMLTVMAILGVWNGLSEDSKDATVFFVAMFVILLATGFALLQFTKIEGEYCIAYAFFAGLFGGFAVLGLVKAVKSVFAS